MQNLLPHTDYTVARFTKKTRVNGLDRFKELLETEAPSFVGKSIDGYALIGKTAVFQQYVAEKDGDIFNINIKRIPGAGATGGSGAKVTRPTKDLSLMNLATKKLRDVHFDDSLFIPMKSETAIDYCFSNDGGIMPGTNYIVIGDPGIGKSSVTIEHAARVQQVNPDKKVLFISAEMTELDMIPYTKRFPLWLDIETLFVSDLTEELYKESIEAKLAEGFDLILADSFAELADAVRGDYNETVAGKDKKSYNDIEKWLVDLMVKNNKGENEENKNTAFVMIQQMTKGGDFVGSNKLKHNTTGMIELRYTKSGDRKIVVSKNRRGFQYDNLHFTFGTDTDMPVEYDTDRILRDKRVEEEIKKAASEQLDQEQETDAWFNQLGNEPAATTEEILQA
jgi:KaiC/GvpD/RAD55 family RecA-like ATPase